MNKLLNTFRIGFWISMFFTVCFILSIVIQLYIRMNTKTPKELTSYSLYVTNLTKIYKNYPIIFNTTDNTVMGSCFSIKDLPLFITINTKYWKKLSTVQRKLLVLHEIGHCTFNLEHDDRLFKDYCPKSLMHSTGFPDWCVEKHGMYYYENEFLEKINK